MIAISGKMRAGKTTLANRLSKSTAAPVRSFAEPLKNGLRCMGVDVYGPERDREAMQAIGLWFRENRDPDWWVKAFHGYTVEDRHFTGCIIDDMRFKNEHQWAREKGFLLVRIETPYNVRLNRGANPELEGHISETDLDDETDWDITLRWPGIMEVAQQAALDTETLKLVFDCWVGEHHAEAA